MLSCMSEIDLENAVTLSGKMRLADSSLVSYAEGSTEALTENQIIENALPRNRDRKKKGEEDEIEETKEGVQIFIPKKKNKKVKYPKGYNPETPGPMPDPERWLPKWQKTKYRKMMKRRGLLRGAQGDQVDDVMKPEASTANIEATQGTSSKKNRRRK